MIIISSVVLIILGGSIYLRSLLHQFHQKGIEIADIEEKKIPLEDRDNHVGEEDVSEPIDPYIKMIRNSKRINILFLGMAYPHTDTIMVASIDPMIKEIDVISIPRDTYFYREGFDNPGQKKINASHVGKDTAAKVQSSMNAVRDILQIPIHHFVKVEYEGVEKIVDSIGGVEIDIPFNMYYDDPLDNLHIRFSKGKQILSGADSVKYLRFRKNNDNTQSHGDLARIERQQDFVKKAFKKATTRDLITSINIAKNYIKTSMTVEEMIYFANKFSRIDEKNLNTHILPGETVKLEGLDFYIHNELETKDVIIGIYSGTSLTH